MDLKTQIMTISGKKLTYYDIGNADAPPILLGHSYLWDKMMWREQFADLSTHYRLIVPDLWAHGEAAGLLDEAVSIQSLADDYWQLMQALGLESFAIIGLSVGGMWGTQLALDHPENVKSLIIMGTFVGAEPKSSQQTYLGLLHQFKAQHGFSDALLESTWPYFYSEKLPDNSPLIAELKKRLQTIPQDHVEDIYKIGVAIFTRSSNLDQLKQLKMPFAIVTGEDDIARVPHEAELMAQAAETDNLAFVKDAGHISVLEQPSVVNQLLMDCLSRSYSP